MHAARLRQRVTVCRSNPRHCRKDSPEGFRSLNSRLEHVVCDRLDLKHSEMREMPPGLGRTRRFSEAPWAGSTLNGGCLDSGKLVWAWRGRASPYRVASGPETTWLQALRPESSDSPVLCFSPTAMPSRASPPLSTPTLGLLFSCSLWLCVCVCVQAPLHHGFRAGSGGLPGLCSFSILRASLCSLLFLQWFSGGGARQQLPNWGRVPAA